MVMPTKDYKDDFNDNDNGNDEDDSEGDEDDDSDDVGDEVEDLTCPGQEPLHSWLPVHFPTRTIFKVTF